jgi:RNA polymerase sigma-70 factor (ECF subfamily)
MSTATQDPQRVGEQFDALFQRSRRRVYRFAYHLTGNAADAEDVMQDAYVRAWQHFDRFDITRSFEGWLFRIITNRVIDLRRRQKRVPMYSLDTAFYLGEETHSISYKFAAPHSDPEEIVVEPILEETLQQALAGLPANYRTAILLCDVDEYSYQDIAATMQCAIGTVRSRIHRARVLLRNNMHSAPGAPALPSRD